MEGARAWRGAWVVACAAIGADTLAAADGAESQPHNGTLGSHWAVNISRFEPLFNDPSVRIRPSLAACTPGENFGSVAVVPQGEEFHTANGKDDWSFLDHAVNCSGSGDDVCEYASFSGGFYHCAVNHDSLFPHLNCDCEQCPCPDGVGGFGCSQCLNDSACSPGFSCSTSTVIPPTQAKAYTCSFTSTENAYKLFWPNGWSHPQGLFHWDPIGDTLTLDILQNMCSRGQPLLLQCKCHSCDYMQDILDPITKELDGQCSDKGLPTPCGKCSACSCDYPPDSILASTTRWLIDGVHSGLYFGCTASGHCVGLLDDFPLPLHFECTTGHCTEDPYTPMYVEGSVLDGWTTRAFGALIGIATVALSVAVHAGVMRFCQRRLAYTAPPLAPPPTCSSGLVLQWDGVHCLRAGKVVLADASGCVSAAGSSGKLVAVTGPSGCGKTTLLDALSGRGQLGDLGAVHLDGALLSSRRLRRYVGYVPQREVLGATLTVRENLEFAAALRLPSLSTAERAGRVRWALTRLELGKVAGSRVGDDSARGVSGGERRRTAIAMELLVAPAVMVLDEPTTGLDAAGALSLGQLLAGLAEEGRLLLCSLHQPRPELMRLFHEHIELQGGVVVKHDGNAHTTDVERRDVVVMVGGAVGEGGIRGSCGAGGTHLGGRVRADAEGQPQVLLGREHEDADSKAKAADAPSPPAAPEPSPLPPQTPPLAERSAARRPSRWVCFREQPRVQPMCTTLWPFQLLVLWRRSLVEACRGSRRAFWSAAVALGVGLFCGLVFKGVDNGVSGVQNRFGSIFFVQMFFAFCGLEVCTLWYYERPRAEHERASCFYRASAYFVAKALSYLFWYCFVLPGLFVGASYALIGYSSGSIAKPLFYYLCVCGTAAASSGICLLILSLTSSLGAGVSTSAITLTIFLMFSGFLRPKLAIPPALRWLLSISPFSHSFAAMIANELQGVTTVFDAEGYDRVDLTGDVWLYQFDIEPDMVSWHAHRLMLIAVIVWLAAFVPIWHQSYKDFSGTRSRTAFARCTRQPVRVLHSTPTNYKVPQAPAVASTNIDDGADVTGNLDASEERNPCVEGDNACDEATNNPCVCLEENEALEEQRSANPPSRASRGWRTQAGDALVWDGLSATLPSGIPLFENLSGVARSGRPLAVLGPSGCGKTTLLSCLAGEGCRPSGCRGRSEADKGCVAVGGSILSPAQRLRSVGFVRQDDALHAAITVREALSFAAALRLPDMLASERAAAVDEVIERLGLQDVADSCLGGERRRGVSGGERRRTAVGVELVAAKKALVLDEPTSGLDADGALGLCRLLAELAAEGHIVVASLHQPRPEVLAHFSDLLLLAPGGLVAYHGPRAGLEAHLNSVCGAPEIGDSQLAATTASDRALDAVASPSAAALAEAFGRSEYARRLGAEVRGTMEKMEARHGGDSDTVSEADREQQVPARDTAPVCVQFWQLLLREARITVREPGLALWHYGAALFAGLLLGAAFYQLPRNLVGVISRIGLFYALQCILGMQALQSLMAWRDGHTCFLRERAAGYYCTGAYVIAKAVVDGLVLRVGPPLLLGAVLYPLAGLRDGCVALFLVALCFASICSSAFCLALGALAPRSAVGLPMAVLLLELFLLFGGVMLAEAPAWLARLSYFRATYSLLVTNEFTGETFDFDPVGINKDFDPLPGEEWLRVLHFSAAPASEHVGYLVGFLVVFIGSAWAFLSAKR